ncbi:hypothetical protein ANN_20170 [Periplaneta americana]|uniref:DUF4817 domain-containing protein n=1 Tax=Periplaneta americana TaxID=6978 RepID=A0ABQ8SD05_PERAM|nr:hypothetical protein ANN_20170 [Periplaneta americana]
MDENGRPSNKQKKRRKVRKQPVEIEGNIELVEDNPALEGSQDDDMQAVSEPEAGGSLQKSARDCSVVEPVQAPASLPADKVYVERKNGFATTPRIKMFQPINYPEEGLVDAEYSRSVGSPLELAILIQKCCRPLYTLCHGLLGGMALLHIIVVYGAGNAFSKDINFVEMYTSYARVYQTLFHILAILCFISIMDRCDMKHMDVNHLTDLFYYHFSTILVFLVYFITLILTFVTTKWDDWFALSPKGLSIEQESLFSTFCVNVKMQYTLNQRLFFVKQYWITNSITATQRAYQREFGVRNPPKRNTILGLVNKLETTGSLVSEKGKHRSSRLPTVVVDVRARLEQSPKKSLRRLSQETGYFQQDGATCHTSNESMELIGSFFDDRIISRNVWPPRSPDLTTPDFFLWGYLKDRVYATRPQTLDDLKHNITQEIQAIDNRVLQRVASNMERRVELCLMQDGGHFQHLL